MGRSEPSGVQHCEPHPSSVVGHGDDFSTSLQFLHALRWCRPSRRSAPQRQPGAVDRPAAPAADIRRRQLRQLQTRSGRAVAGRGRAVLPAVLRRSGDAAGGQEEAVRQARGAAGRRALPRRRVRCRQDPPVGVELLRDYRCDPARPDRRRSRRSASSRSWPVFSASPSASTCWPITWWCASTSSNWTTPATRR